MPVVTFRVADLEALVGGDVSRDALRGTIPKLGADPDDTAGDTWAVEFFPDRPDLFTVEGLARALRTYLGRDAGLRRYEVAEPTTTLTVDPSVAGVRPYIAGAFVRGVDLHHRLEGLIELQEDLHWGLGSRRRKVAIGVHDAARVEPPFRYLAAEPGAVSFVPLQSTEEMDLATILAKHPKGVEHAHLLEDLDRYPVILDAEDRVLSFPPIINGRLTTVTGASRDLFVDVTGWDAWAVEKALNILVTSLAEAGGAIEAITLEGGHRDRTPELAPEERELAVAEVNRVLGSGFTAEEVAERLRRMGFGAEAAGDASVAVEVPAYRVDILHDVDLVEDVAIGHGYEAFPSERPRVVTYGRALPGSELAERVRWSLVGQGFLELVTLSLTSEGDAFERLGRQAVPAVRLRNPVTEDHTMLRGELLPSLLRILRANVHRDLPQRVFEVGTVTPVVDGAAAAKLQVVGVALAPKVGFTEAKGWVQALARDLGWDLTVEAAEDPAFVEGRCARAVVEGEAGGLFGELHPRTIAAFDLGNPAVAFELDL